MQFLSLFASFYIVTMLSLSFHCGRAYFSHSSTLFGRTYKKASLSRLSPNSIRAMTSVNSDQYSAHDTIYALSSGSLTKSGIAVIRLSGPLSSQCAEKLMTSPASPIQNDFKQSDKSTHLLPRMATYKKLFCPQTRELLDQSIVLWFPGPKSFTGEDVVELHVHGSRAVIQGVFKSLEYMSEISGQSIRPATHGEFTKRAFENGKMDLTEVEGLADLLDAETSQQRLQALRQMDGHMKKVYDGWREVLLTCLAHTEAVIDFGDDDRENDVDDEAMWKLIPKVERLAEDIQRHLNDKKVGEIIREGLKIAIIGPPNAGKSSLLNQLARRPAAIVSPIAGTTRDVVEVRMDLGGVPCIIRDTAGIREQSEDPVEKEGIKRSIDALESSHVCIFVGDSSDVDSMTNVKSLLQETMEKNKNDTTFIRHMMFVLNKADLCTSVNEVETIAKGIQVFSLSCSTGEGIGQLENGLVAAVKNMLHRSEGDEESVLITRSRHRQHLKQCLEHLERFLSKRHSMDLAAEELRLANHELGKITGRVDVEELLDIIFRDFCIGK